MCVFVSNGFKNQCIIELPSSKRLRVKLAAVPDFNCILDFMPTIFCK